MGISKTFLAKQHLKIILNNSDVKYLAQEFWNANTNALRIAAIATTNCSMENAKRIVADSISATMSAKIFAVKSALHAKRNVCRNVLTLSALRNVDRFAISALSRVRIAASIVSARNNVLKFVIESLVTNHVTYC